MRLCNVSILIQQYQFAIRGEESAWYTERMSEYKLYLGDCLDFMRTLPDNSVDAVITSPPYNMRTRIRNGEYTGRESSGDFSNKYSDFSDDMPIDEYYKFHGLVIENILRISSLAFINIQIVTGSKEAWFRLIGDFSKRIRDIIVWDKGEGQPAMHPAVVNRSSELVIIFESGAIAGRAFNKSYFERGTMPDIWRVARDGSSVEGHGAVFPLSIPLRIINGWTCMEETVFDPFMGTGTTGVACMKTGRDFMGCEIAPVYYAMAEKRIREAASQMLLPLE